MVRAVLGWQCHVKGADASAAASERQESRCHAALTEGSVLNKQKTFGNRRNQTQAELLRFLQSPERVWGFVALAHRLSLFCLNNNMLFSLFASAENFSTVQKEVYEIMKGRILVGHALKNDLKVSRVE